MRHLIIILTLLFTISFSVNAQDTTQNNPTVESQYENLLGYFFAAARTNDTDVIDQFVNAGIPINSFNKKGYTALMIATYHGNKKSVDTLLQLGANACLEDNRGNTALMAAIFRGEFSIAKTLVSLDCDNEHENKAGQTAQQFAETFGQQKVLDLLAQVKTKNSLD
ncbi:ankyrin repeat domain-containing protein [Pseudoalteromonas sp. MMG010]|uniref:ankyrin repeat domain-containing protein n=1 Tax=Pseudoalteromonas sp. MMG010 TaxID=2822685 RepID=UPI001B3A514F|nr:ankyrin repeat domain-containing protein [Pseudoalteromonas sp. MMG010]MBQ4833819.1 ankyrin repeat domain-containing protein [Pseudoalteromonas sp. MMG010]